MGGKEGVLYLMDGSNLGGSGHDKTLYTSPLIANDEEWFEAKGIWGGLSFWRDAQDRHWVYVPIWGAVSETAPPFPKTRGPNPNGSVAAFLVEDNPDTGTPYLKPAWVSGDFSVPEPVVIANGVVFALSNGENVRQTVEAGIMNPRNLTLLKDQQRVGHEARAELRALDAETGELLYDSGPDVFKTWTHFSGIALANGQIYAVDYSSTVYCFGLK